MTSGTVVLSDFVQAAYLRTSTGSRANHKLRSGTTDDYHLVGRAFISADEPPCGRHRPRRARHRKGKN
jgi:hypothetical protein